MTRVRSFRSAPTGLELDAETGGPAAVRRSGLGRLILGLLIGSRGRASKV